MDSSPVREDVRFGEVFSTPTGNHRKRTNLVFNINNAGVEQVVGQYEEKLTPAETKLLQSGREERLRIEDLKGLEFLRGDVSKY